MHSDQSQYKKYESPTGELQTRELRLGEWYLRHRFHVRLVLTGLLIGWCALTIGFSFWQWGEYLLFGYSEDTRLLSLARSQFQNYADLQKRYAAKELSVARVRAFRSAPGKYDFVAFVTNPNQRHLARLRYQFAHPLGTTETQETVLLPGEERPVVLFGQEATQFPSNIRFVIVEDEFRRIDPHAVADTDEFMRERLQFSSGSVVFADGRVAFDVHNGSAYSYWQALLYAQLFSGTELVGILFLPLDRFRAGETRMVDVRLFGDVKRVTEVRLSPVINVFDQSVFLPPGA